MSKRTKTILQTVLFLGMGIALFYWAVSKADIDQMTKDIREAKVSWIIVAAICGVLSHLARALRWNLLLEPLDYRASMTASFHAVMLGYLVNLAVPRLGEVARPAALSKMEHLPFNKLVGTVVVERVVDLIITVLLAIAIAFLQLHLISDYANEVWEQSNTEDLWLYGLIAALVLGLVVYLYRIRKRIYALPVISKLQGFIEGLLDGIKTIGQLKRTGLFIFYSLFIWLMYFCMSYFMLFALEGTAHLGVSAGLTVLLFGTAAMIIPIPGGIGAFQYLVPIGLGLYQVSESAGLSFAILTHAAQVLLILVVGIVSVIYFLYKTQKDTNGVE